MRYGRDAFTVCRTGQNRHWNRFLASKRFDFPWHLCFPRPRPWTCRISVCRTETKNGSQKRWQLSRVLMLVVGFCLPTLSQLLGHASRRPPNTTILSVSTVSYQWLSFTTGFWSFAGWWASAKTLPRLSCMLLVMFPPGSGRASQPRTTFCQSWCSQCLRMRACPKSFTEHHQRRTQESSRFLFNLVEHNLERKFLSKTSKAVMSECEYLLGDAQAVSVPPSLLSTFAKVHGPLCTSNPGEITALSCLTKLHRMANRTLQCQSLKGCGSPDYCTLDTSSQVKPLTTGSFARFLQKQLNCKRSRFRRIRIRFRQAVQWCVRLWERWEGIARLCDNHRRRSFARQSHFPEGLCSFSDGSHWALRTARQLIFAVPITKEPKRKKLVRL